MNVPALARRVARAGVAETRRRSRPIAEELRRLRFRISGWAGRALNLGPPRSVWPKGQLLWDAPAEPWRPLRDWLGPRQAFIVLVEGNAKYPATVVVDGDVRSVICVRASWRWVADLDQGQREVLMTSCDAAVSTTPPQLAVPQLEHADWVGSMRTLDLRARAACRRLETLGEQPPRLMGPPTALGRPSRRILVAGHDLKFAAGLIEWLNRQGHQVLIDQWQGHGRHDEAHSRDLLSQAEIIFCEWALGNAVWYTRNARPDQRVIVRLHLQEIHSHYLGRMRSPDALVVVGPYLKRVVCRNFGLSPKAVTVVPNAVRVPVPPRSAKEERRFALGLVGITPARKRLDLALDLVCLLRDVDPRFHLLIKGKKPEDYAWFSKRSGETRFFEDQNARIRRDPRLGDAVRFIPFSPDMEEFWGSVGFALSMSDFESFHFTLPDGAANGCVPLSLPWIGADELYPKSWIAPDVDALAHRIVETAATADTWQGQAAAAHTYVEQRFEHLLVLESLERLITGEAS